MKAFKNMLALTMVLSIIASILTSCSVKTISSVRMPVKAGVLLYSFDDEFALITKQSLEEIQKENENKIEFTFFDGKGNLAIENEVLNKMIESDFDIIIASILDKQEQDVI